MVSHDEKLTLFVQQYIRIETDKVLTLQSTLIERGVFQIITHDASHSQI